MINGKSKKELPQISCKTWLNCSTHENRIFKNIKMVNFHFLFAKIVETGKYSRIDIESNFSIIEIGGKVRAEEIKVYNTWADYVFKKEYHLPTLQEVEQYIVTNGHLQNVPSAKEVTEKGLELGEMAKIQQEKIEELMLYIIAQNKRIEALEKKINNK